MATPSAPEQDSVLLPVIVCVAAFSIFSLAVAFTLMKRFNRHQQPLGEIETSGAVVPRLLADKVLLIYDSTDEQVRDQAASLHQTLLTAGISTVSVNN